VSVQMLTSLCRHKPGSKTAIIHHSRRRVALQLHQGRALPDMLLHSTGVCCSSSWRAMITAWAPSTC
jgi:hypothetical protein